MQNLVNQYPEPLAVLSRPEPAVQQGAIALLRDFIAAGSYGPGDRLPAERELIVELGISRSTHCHGSGKNHGHSHHGQEGDKLQVYP